MTEFLLNLAALTVGGALAVLVFALAARASRSRYGARWRCWIWLLLCLRLLVPYSWFFWPGEDDKAPIQISAPSDEVIFKYDFPEAITPPSTAFVPSVSVQPSVTPLVPAEEHSGTDASEPKQPELELTLSDILFLVWVIGAIAMAMWILISHLHFVRYVRRWSDPVTDPEIIRLYNQLGDQLSLGRRPNLRVCSGLKAPMLAGIFFPRLLLSENLPVGDELRYTLIHELLHFRRRDIWLKGIALLTNVVHWFNPLIWYMVRRVERDTEMACDEAALRSLSQDDYAAYGRTILNAVERLKLKSGK